MQAFRTTIAMMAPPSIGSPSMVDTAAAPTRIKTTTLRNCSRNNRSAEVGGAAVSRFAPCSMRRRCASATDSPR